jgi:hypothetical protein
MTMPASFVSPAIVPWYLSGRSPCAVFRSWLGSRCWCSSFRRRPPATGRAPRAASRQPVLRRRRGRSSAETVTRTARSSGAVLGSSERARPRRKRTARRHRSAPNRGGARPRTVSASCRPAPVARANVAASTASAPSEEASAGSAPPRTASKPASVVAAGSARFAMASVSSGATRTAPGLGAVRTTDSASTRTATASRRRSEPPYSGVTTISTRRLLARPSAVVFVAMGRLEPRPVALILSEGIPRETR